MKKILLTIAAIALFAVPASAQVYSVWADAEMSMCESYGAAYTAFPVFLVLSPGPTGVFGAEYMLTVPASLIIQVTNPSPVISVAMGDNPSGISLGFTTCQTDPFVVFDFMMFPMDVNPGHIMVEAHPGTGKLIIAECPGDRIELPATVANYFGWHDTCITGTQESSWGAIKSMMD